MKEEKERKVSRIKLYDFINIILNDRATKNSFNRFQLHTILNTEIQAV